MNKMLAASLLTTILFVIVLSTPLIFGLLSSTITISSTGTITTSGGGGGGGGGGGTPSPTISFKVYWDNECTDEVTTIDWGEIDVGSTKSVTVYIKNEGDTPITLSLNTTDWNPASASDYISLSWDYSGETIDVGAVIEVTLTLTVDSNISGITSFSFNINITGTEA